MRLVTRSFGRSFQINSVTVAELGTAHSVREGKLLPARTALEHDALPIGLAHGVALTRAANAGDTVRWDDVAIDSALPAVRSRRAMEARGVAV